jgi:hypothetical protein
VTLRGTKVRISFVKDLSGKSYSLDDSSSAFRRVAGLENVQAVMSQKALPFASLRGKFQSQQRLEIEILGFV